MRRSFLFTLALLLARSGVPAGAQTVQQDRRIEEEKRESLKPTVATLTPPLAVPTQLPSPPVPQPFQPLYFAMLAQKRIAYGYDAAKSLVILLGVDEEYLDLTSQVRYLQEQQLLPPRLQQSFDPMQPLRKGVAAYLFSRALKLDGGLMLHLFGRSERYAVKELVFQGFMSTGHVNDLVSGTELVQLMSQAAAYLAQRVSKRGP